MHNKLMPLKRGSTIVKTLELFRWGAIRTSRLSILWDKGFSVIVVIFPVNRILLPFAEVAVASDLSICLMVCGGSCCNNLSFRTFIEAPVSNNVKIGMLSRDMIILGNAS
uniref:Transmembrane protein n=1 Tax=Strongyloides stercoralis TaxID=6248 RepID=A0A0K0E078_STRER